MELLLHEINTISNKNLYNKYMDKEEFRQKVNSLIENNLEIEEEPVFTKLTQEDIDLILKEETITIDLDGERLDVTPNMVDVRIDAKEGFNVGMENNKFIILNIIRR